MLGQGSITIRGGWTRRLNLWLGIVLLLAVGLAGTVSGAFADVAGAGPAANTAFSRAGAAGGAALAMPPANDYLAIHPSAFVTNNNDLAYKQTGTAVQGVTTGDVFLANAPVQLPHGAEIRRLEVVADDHTTDDDINVVLWRAPDSPAAPVTITSVSTAGDSGTQTLVSEDLAYEVDNSTESYVVFISWEVPTSPTDLQVRNVRIVYWDHP